MPEQPEVREQRESRTAGCGVQGCLAAAVGLFVVLLVALLFIAVIRFSSPPQPRFGQGAAPLMAGAAVAELGVAAGGPERPVPATSGGPGV